MIGFCLVVILVLGLYFHLEPYIDFSRNGDILLWYNSGGRHNKERVFIVLFKIK